MKTTISARFHLFLIALSQANGWLTYISVDFAFLREDQSPEYDRSAYLLLMVVIMARNLESIKVVW